MSDLTIDRRKQRWAPVQQPRPIQLTERDLDMLEWIGRHRLMHRGQIGRVIGSASQKLQYRVRSLFDHGYLARPTAQISFLKQQGSRPFVYELTSKGVDTLESARGIPRRAIEWSGKRDATKPRFIEHTLLVADIVIGFELACRELGGLRLIPQHDIIGNVTVDEHRHDHPMTWIAEVPEPGRAKRRIHRIKPDRAMQLVTSDGASANFLLEADRGTMPIQRKLIKPGQRQTWYAEKLAAYYWGWKARRHEEQFGWDSFRVLTVTTSETRIEQMVDCVMALTEGRGSALFCFATEAALAHSNPLQLSWMNGKGETIRLLD